MTFEHEKNKYSMKYVKNTRLKATFQPAKPTESKHTIKRTTATTPASTYVHKSTLMEI